MGFSSRCSSAATERCNAELTFELREFPDCAAFPTQIPRDDFVIEEHEFRERGFHDVGG
jgi:hypothetical protein